MDIKNNICWSDVAPSKGRNSAPKKNTMVVAREISRVQTAKRLPEDLFSMLSSKEKENAIAISIKHGGSGNFLEQLTEGLDMGVLGSKVIIELCNTLYEQSEDYGTEKELLGITPIIESNLSEEEKAELEISKLRKAGGKSTNGDYTQAIAPYITFSLSQFTKGVFGGVEPSWRQKEDVANILTKLHTKDVILSTDKGAFVTDILRRYIYIDKETKAKTYVVRLNPIFRRNIENDFIVLRKDTNKRLRSKPSEMAIRLMWLLAVAHSYKNVSGLTYRISKRELLQRIAVNKSYQSKPKRMKEDFIKAVEKMKDLYLLENNSGAYKEETGANGEIISIFKLNPNYNTEGEEVDYTIVD